MNNDDQLLLNAVKSSDIALVKALIAGGSVNVNACIGEVQRGTFLCLAAHRGCVAIVARLLDSGARINDVDGFEDSACHIAAREGHTDVVALLVCRNADVTLRNRANELPIDFAILKSSSAMVMLLIDAAMAAGAPLDEATMCSAAAISVDIIRLLLLKHRVNLSTIRNRIGRTPLHQAVWRDSDASVLKTLIEVAGVDVDARDQNGHTAVHVACMSINVGEGALTCLIAAGANLDLAEWHGKTALHYNGEDVGGKFNALLLAAGANVHAKNIKGRTPCHQACSFRRASLPALLAFGANLDEPDNDGVTRRRMLMSAPPTAEEVELARRRVLSVQLSFVSERALEVCIAFQTLGLDALCMCEILLHSCGPVAPLIAFHRWWQIATTIKHFRGAHWIL